jgi:hypothetical protein
MRLSEPRHCELIHIAVVFSGDEFGTGHQKYPQEQTKTQTGR